MDIIDKLIVSDVITRSQYYDSRKGQDDDAPLRRLMLAVLRDALACLSSGASGSASNSRKEAREAAEWIGNKTDESLFSFNCVCETLSIHPDALRESLEHWLASGSRLTRRSPVIPDATPRVSRSSVGTRT